MKNFACICLKWIHKKRNKNMHLCGGKYKANPGPTRVFWKNYVGVQTPCNCLMPISMLDMLYFCIDAIKLASIGAFNAFIIILVPVKFIEICLYFICRVRFCKIFISVRLNRLKFCPHSVGRGLPKSPAERYSTDTSQLTLFCFVKINMWNKNITVI